MKNILLGCCCGMLLSCANIIGEEEPETVRKDPILEAMVDINTMSGSELYTLTDKANWRLLYIYSYTKVLNDYAAARGWTPPDINPLCHHVVREKVELLPIPEFDSVGDPELASLEYELALYIKILRRASADEAALTEMARELQRELCVF